MSSFAFKKASDLVSSLSEHFNSQDLKLINKVEDFRQLLDVTDSGVSNSQSNSRRNDKGL